MNNNLQNSSAKVHNQTSLSEYNLYANDNQFLRSAFFVTPGVVKVTIMEGLELKMNDLALWQWDYDVVDVFGNFDVITLPSPEFVQVGNKVTFSVAHWDDSKSYGVSCFNEQVSIYLDPSIGGILDDYFDATVESDFGVRLVNGVAKFKVWSPPAAQIEVVVFDRDQQPITTESKLWMQKLKKGVFALNVTPEMASNLNFDGLYYQYRVFAYGKSSMALDPYSFSMASFNPEAVDLIGKGAIVVLDSELSMPQDFQKKYSNAQFMANEVDLVAYELHIRDFTIQAGAVKSDVAGTFMGPISKVDYLKNLGITHVQLLPVMNFYTVDENNRSYSASDSLKSNYNWGYDPHSYFALEGWFSSDARNPYVRIKEFRELVQTFHNKGIGVIMDVVYNHTYIEETFENIAPGCYYRLRPDLAISGHSGAGPSVECRRKMVRKLIVDSLRFFVCEYHVDGFRFDLMGFLDHETMRMIRREVGAVYNSENPNELILHGEAWVFSDLDTSTESVGENAATTKINYPSEDLNLGFFNDTCRDGFAGTPHQQGYVQGNFAEVDRVATAIVGGLKGFNPGAVSFNNNRFRDGYNLFAKHPSNCLNFLSVHDGMTLWDKFNLHSPDVVGYERARLFRLASAMLFTSQGKIILHGGDELLRTKPLSKVDKERHRAFTSKWANEEEGTCYYHENTYSSNDFTNMIRWSRLHNQFAPIARQMVEYYKGLILMRRAIPALRLAHGADVKKALSFIPSTSQIAMEIPAYFGDFSDDKLQQLVLKFIHGPANTTCYLAGEIHPQGVDVNPLENPYKVVFDAAGHGQIAFSRAQIEQFDLGKWGDGISLNFKLVILPGSWLTLEKSYLHSGNNVVMIQGVEQNGEVTIDLAIPNHWVGITPSLPEPWIAYLIDNTLENDVASHLSKTDYAKVLVIHNAADKASSVYIPAIQNPADWQVILDANSAGITPLPYASHPQKGETDVLVSRGKVVVPAKSSAVIGCGKL